MIFANKASVCKYIVPQGYPDNARDGELVVLPPQLPADVKLYLGAVDMKNGKLVATELAHLGDRRHWYRHRGGGKDLRAHRQPYPRAWVFLPLAT